MESTGPEEGECTATATEDGECTATCDEKDQSTDEGDWMQEEGERSEGCSDLGPMRPGGCNEIHLASWYTNPPTPPPTNFEEPQLTGSEEDLVEENADEYQGPTTPIRDQMVSYVATVLPMAHVIHRKYMSINRNVQTRVTHKNLREITVRVGQDMC